MSRHSKLMSSSHIASGSRGIGLIVLLSAALSLPAHASALGDFEAGYSALLHKNYDRAIALFTDAIASGDLRPANLALAYHYRGAEYLKTGRDDEAIADFDRALALNATLFTAYYDRGVAFKRKGDLTRAIADYSEAIRLHPNLNYFYLHRGAAYAANSQYEEAIADYKLALFYRPDSVPAFVALGDAHLAQGRNVEALADYRQAMRRHGDFLKLYPGVAAKLTALGAMPEANKLVLRDTR